MSFTAGIEYVDYRPLSTNQTTRTLVCLHGIGGDHNSFKPQLQELSDCHRVLAWNMPGYRGSTSLQNLQFDTLRACFIDWLDALNLDQVDIMGQSIGGMLAQEIAFHHPGRVRSLLLVATTSAFGGRDDTFRNTFLKARLAPLDNGETMSDLARRFVPEIVGSGACQSCVDAAVASMSAVPASTYRQIMQCLVTFNGREQWTKLGCDMCLIAGQEDYNAPARTMEKMSAKLDEMPMHNEYHCIAGAGHLVNLEQAQTCNAIVRGFLSMLQN